MTKKSVNWQRDPEILDRIQRHVELVRKGLTPELVCKLQSIDRTTYWRDAQRALELARRVAGQAAADLIAEADAWYRQCIGDADKESAQRTISSTAKAMHQGNKRSAVDSYVKLHGLNRPQKVDLSSTGDLVIRYVNDWRNPSTDAT